MEPPTQRYLGHSAETRLARRRSQLIEAGIELFGTIGHRASSIDEICSTAGLTKRYFYESFGNREELLLATYDHINGELTGELTAAITTAVEQGADTPEIATTIVRTLFEFVDKDRRRGQVLFIDVLGVSPTVQTHYMSNIESWVQTVANLVAVDTTGSVPAERLARTALGTVVGLILEWLQSGRDDTPEDLLQAVLALYSGELFTPRPRATDPL